jgi:toxin HigB-1
MILSFADKGSEDFYNGENTKATRRIPAEIHKVAFRKLVILNSAQALQDLRVPPANRLEALKGDREGQFSIRINDKWRIVFKWENNNASDVAIVDYH